LIRATARTDALQEEIMSKRKDLEAQEAKKARSRNIQVIGIISFLAVSIIGGALLISRNQQGGRIEVPLPSVVAANKAIPANAESSGIAWGPKEAPIKIEEFIDYQCPGCKGQWSAYDEEIVAALSKTGKVRFEYNFLTFIEQRGIAFRDDSSNAANAAMCAADQGKFFEMHNTLFTNQIDENSGQFKAERVKQMAALIGVPDKAKFDGCIDAGTHKGRLTTMADDASKRQVQSTPSFFVNGKLYPGSQSLEALRKIFTEVAPSVALD
jgi:protein-disulfide isomerase